MQAFNPNTINFTDQAILHFTNALSGKPDEFAIRIGVRVWLFRVRIFL